MKLVDNESGRTVYADEGGKKKFNHLGLETQFSKGVRLDDFMVKEGQFQGRPVVKITEPDFTEALKLKIGHSTKYHWED
ncbi:MAG: hypothetical protein WC222_11755 [Parachlamydiales bacterium]|jgi:hypothetical protein